MQLSNQVLDCRLEDASASTVEDKEMIDEAVRDFGGFDMVEALLIGFLLNV